MRMTAALLCVGLAVAAPRNSFADQPPAPPPEHGWFAGARGTSVKLQAGPAFRKIGSVTAFGADMNAAVGAQTTHGGWYGAAGLLLASTEAGLGMRQLRVGISWEAPVGPVQLGIDGPRLSALWMDRATTSKLLEGLGLGIGVLAGVDIAVCGPVVIAAGLRFGGEHYFRNVVLWGGSAHVGVRLIQLDP